jgi:photosystem II stability/assembly factor-like uncharacterized protein
MIRVRKFFILSLCLIFFQTANAEWMKQNSNTLAWLHDIYFINEKKGWITGSDGTFLETTDGGKSWRQANKFTSDTIRQVYFFDEEKGWLLCERSIYNRGSSLPSYVLQTVDGGVNWEKMEFAKTGHERIAKIIFNEKGAALAFGEGGVFFALDEDKKSWQKTPFFIKYLLLDGVYTDNSNGAIVGAGGSIIFTEDGGASWNKANIFGDKSAKLNSVFFINRKTGWSVGANGKIFQTLSGGKTWREQTSRTTVNLNDIFFTDTAQGWAVGDEGTILHTKTAGNVWNYVDSGAKHKLEKITFVGDKGWAVGFGGTILFYDENTKAEKSAAKPSIKKWNR